MVKNEKERFKPHRSIFVGRIKIIHNVNAVERQRAALLVTVAVLGLFKATSQKRMRTTG
jgi:hypothetical protein